MLSEFGRIGRDAELRFTPSGTAVCNIAVAYDYGRKGDDGRKPSQWVDITIWGKQAEGLAPYLLKGKQIYFSARDVRVETYPRRDGGEGFKLTGDLVDIKFANDGSGGQQSQSRQPAQQQGGQQYYGQQQNNSGQQYQGQQQSAQQSHPADDAFDDDSDIPF